MQKNSTYNKIRETLEAASKHTGEINVLAESIRESNEAFVYYKRGEDEIVREYPCDLPTIRRKIRFCIDLRLIQDEENCILTDNGRNAISKGKARFDLQLQQSIIEFLEDCFVSAKFGPLMIFLKRWIAYNKITQGEMHEHQEKAIA